ncbi:MAG: FmdB family regulatory protein [Anaerolineaceae bacterium]|nr:MAG: FmdB family regulatory protein [Anaerolineaceae bacterium]
MPIFEFVCTDCEQSFEELLRNSEAASGVICPKCGSAQVRKKLSAFASKISGGSSFSLGAPSVSSCGGST